MLVTIKFDFLQKRPALIKRVLREATVIGLVSLPGGEFTLEVGLIRYKGEEWAVISHPDGFFRLCVGDTNVYKAFGTQMIHSEDWNHYGLTLDDEHPLFYREGPTYYEVRRELSNV
jgi:hypothetical protein